MAEVRVRYYAGMVDRAGTEEETFTDVETLTDLKEAVIARHGDQITSPLSACSLLVDGQVVSDSDLPVRGLRVEVLPPFAGG